MNRMNWIENHIMSTLAHFEPGAKSDFLCALQTTHCTLDERWNRRSRANRQMLTQFDLSESPNHFSESIDKIEWLIVMLMKWWAPQIDWYPTHVKNASRDACNTRVEPANQANYNLMLWRIVVDLFYWNESNDSFNRFIISSLITQHRQNVMRDDWYGGTTITRIKSRLPLVVIVAHNFQTKFNRIAAT